MSRSSALSAALLCSVLLSAMADSRAEDGPQYRDPKSQSLGRTGVASSQGGTALYLNPAALGREEGGGMGLSMDLGLNSVLLDYAAWASDNRQYLDNMDSLLARIGPVDNKWAPFSQSLLLYGNWQGVAFSALVDTRYKVTVARAVLTPVLGVGALSDVVLTAGKGFRADYGYRFGFALKYIHRSRFEDRLIGATDDPFYTAKKALENPDDGWSGTFAKLGVAGEIAESSQGAGLNLGAEKDLNQDWTAGLSLIDFPTIIDQAFTRPDINLGLSYHHGVQWMTDLENKVLVNLDWQRFLIPGTPWFKQLKMGAALEGYLNKRPVGYIGIGINDGYPTFGLRFGYLVYLSYVYVAEEVGTYPGQEKLSFHKIGLEAEF
ncbi:MAG: hypothetical protein ABIW76_23535 [Fibrobacteria bacterium]